MKNNYFVVMFEDDYKTISAKNEEEAKILAQAIRIKEGKDYKVQKISKCKDN